MSDGLSTPKHWTLREYLTDVEMGIATFSVTDAAEADLATRVCRAIATELGPDAAFWDRSAMVPAHLNGSGVWCVSGGVLQPGGRCPKGCDITSPGAQS